MVINFDAIKWHDNESDADCLEGYIEAMKMYLKKKEDIYIEIVYKDKTIQVLENEEDVDKFIREHITQG